MIKTKNYEKTILIFNNNNEIIMRTKNVKMCAEREIVSNHELEMFFEIIIILWSRRKMQSNS